METITRQNIVLNYMKESLKQKIYQKVKNNGYCNLDVLYEIAEETGHRQSTCDRKARELAQVGSIVPVYNPKGHLTGYSKAQVVVITSQKPETASIYPISSPKCEIYRPKDKKPLKLKIEPIGQLQLL